MWVRLIRLSLVSGEEQEADLKDDDDDSDSSSYSSDL